MDLVSSSTGKTLLNPAATASHIEHLTSGTSVRNSLGPDEPSGFDVEGWEFVRGSKYVVIDSPEDSQSHSRYRLSIPLEVWKIAVFQLIEHSELREHGLVSDEALFDSDAASKLREMLSADRHELMQRASSADFKIELEALLAEMLKQHDAEQHLRHALQWFCELGSMRDRPTCLRIHHDGSYSFQVTDHE